jgi:hypothetical protein
MQIGVVAMVVMPDGRGPRAAVKRAVGTGATAQPTARMSRSRPVRTAPLAGAWIEIRSIAAASTRSLPRRRMGGVVPLGYLSLRHRSIPWLHQRIPFSVLLDPESLLNLSVSDSGLRGDDMS